MPNEIPPTTNPPTESEPQIPEGITAQRKTTIKATNEILPTPEEFNSWDLITQAQFCKRIKNSALKKEYDLDNQAIMIRWGLLHLKNPIQELIKEGEISPYRTTQTIKKLLDPEQLKSEIAEKIRRLTIQDFLKPSQIGRLCAKLFKKFESPGIKIGTLYMLIGNALDIHQKTAARYLAFHYKTDKETKRRTDKDELTLLEALTEHQIEIRDLDDIKISIVTEEAGEKLDEILEKRAEDCRITCPHRLRVRTKTVYDPDLLEATLIPPDPENPRFQAAAVNAKRVKLVSIEGDPRQQVFRINPIDLEPIDESK